MENLINSININTGKKSSKNSALNKSSRVSQELLLQKAYFQQLFDNSPQAIAMLNNQHLIITINQAFTKMFGYYPEEVKGMHINDIVIPDFLKWEAKSITDSITNGNVLNRETKRKRKNGDIIDVSILAYPIKLKDVQVGHFCIYSDISQRIKITAELEIQKAYFQQLYENSPEGIVMLDIKDRIVMVNRAFEEIFGYYAEDIQNCYLNDLIVPPLHLEEGETISNAVQNGTTIRLESVRMKKDNTLIQVEILGYPIYYGGKQVGIYGIYSDISQRKNAEDKLRYISMHDPLTGLYNRSFFEEQFAVFHESPVKEIGVIVCDVDGLKIVNDTLGHNKGDEMLLAVSGIIKNCLAPSDFAARIGGDEFVIILPGKTSLEVEGIIKRIRENIAEYNKQIDNLPVNVSMGFAVSTLSEHKRTRDLLIEADNNMYRDKILGRESARNALVQILITALQEKDYITEGHGDRVQEIILRFAKILSLPSRTVSELKLFAHFHDIGKVGIPDSILAKPGSLTPEEQNIMRRHSEIGARIARSSPELIPISDWIFKHHEWWNGTGYPLGLEGAEIPLECRILALADAYDSMTSDRPYRKAMTHQEAIAALKKLSGIQFDPHLTSLIIPILENVAEISN